MSAETQLQEMIATQAAYPASMLMPLFEQLQPIGAAEIIGMWRGGLFDGGKSPTRSSGTASASSRPATSTR